MENRRWKLEGGGWKMEIRGGNGGWRLEGRGWKVEEC